MSEEEKPSFFATQVNVEGQGTEHPEQEDSAGEAELLKEEADTSEELRMLLQEFNVYDKKQIGMVPAENVPAIFSALGYPA